ncbi:MAG: DUF1365 domain-containing protein [Chloroflexota bacterium]
MRSHLLEGKVRHRRARPSVYTLEHDVWYLALDLDELPEVTRSVRLLRRNGPGIATFRDADHLLPPATDIRADVHAHLRAQGVDPTGWRITLVTNLRIFGYVFNPASFFLCRDTSGALAVVVIEVHNTHGERRLYTLHPERRGSSHLAAMDKDFYVSPFIDMDARYRVLVRDEPGRLRIAIDETEHGDPLLATSVTLSRYRLTDRNLARLLVRHPFVTQKTIGMIHWHALRLWRRGITFHHHGDAAR